jgi:hypothetical protein
VERPPYFVFAVVFPELFSRVCATIPGKRMVWRLESVPRWPEAADGALPVDVGLCTDNDETPNWNAWLFHSKNRITRYRTGTLHHNDPARLACEPTMTKHLAGTLHSLSRINRRKKYLVAQPRLNYRQAIPLTSLLPRIRFWLLSRQAFFPRNLVAVPRLFRLVIFFGEPVGHNVIQMTFTPSSYGFWLKIEDLKF